ncbi:MAG: hypothetical protein KDJ65_17095 [Anaerolineae bacterium]|nr:hypothetical protein [Anaerolineae bacterium]
MSLDLLKIFDEFVQDYGSLRLAHHHTRSSFTLRELNYFFELGQRKNYESFTEDMTGSLRLMDLSWWDNYSNGYWHNLVLHLERENLWNKDEETLLKLFQKDRNHVPSNVIGMIPVPDQKRIDELLKIAQSTCNVDNALLIFRVNPYTNTGHRMKAYLFKRNQIAEYKVAYVYENPTTKYLFMNFNSPD